jgi:hypothetical protein
VLPDYVSVEEDSPEVIALALDKSLGAKAACGR